MTNNDSVYVTPGHPTKAGAGYDCHCGECLYVRGLPIVDPGLKLGSHMDPKPANGIAGMAWTD